MARPQIDYRDLDRPTINRRPTVTTHEGSTARKIDQDKDMDYLDIPAFLRRQAD